jgi:hypothetical protein
MIERAGAYYQAPNTVLAHATANLVTIAFFFLLRVGEYAMPWHTIHTQTVRFSVQYITFQQSGIMSPNTMPLAQLAAAKSVMLYTNNQKNGQHGDTI